ncbi:MAG: glycosyltransferase [bacterium]
MRRLDIGVASYGNPVRLEKTLRSIAAKSTTDYRLFIIHNPGAPEDQPARVVIQRAQAENPRIVPIWEDLNGGYAGAVNKFQSLAETEYLAYCDNDIEILTPGWDEALCGYLDRFHEIGMVFPNGGAYQIKRAAYTEIMWGVGFCWLTTRIAISDVGAMDTTLGHHEEVDLAQRMRLAGYLCAAAPEVRVNHEASATNDPKSQERISRGVINWVNKWCRYFGGENLTYHSPNVLRFEDWNALYLEEYWKTKPELAGLNDSPEVITLDGRLYDLIRVPRLKGYYRGRIL